MWVWDGTITDILSLVPFCLKMEGWLSMLQKDRSAPRDMQNTNFADVFSSMSIESSSTDNYIVWRSETFITLSELLGPPVSLPGDGASRGSVISTFPKGPIYRHQQHVGAVHMQSSWISTLHRSGEEGMKGTKEDVRPWIIRLSHWLYLRLIHDIWKVTYEWPWWLLEELLRNNFLRYDGVPGIKHIIKQRWKIDKREEFLRWHITWCQCW